jgi:transposase
MFIRKKPNKSGSYSILLVAGERVLGKKHPVPRIIKSFGSAKGKKQIDILVKQAEEYKSKLEAVSPKAKTLKITSGEDFQLCGSHNVGFNDIYGNAFKSVFSNINLNQSALEQLQNLVTMRIADPASKLKTTQITGEYGIEMLSVDSLYKLMDKLTIPVINNIKKTIYEATSHKLEEQKESVDVLFYDLTTVYFETSTQDEMRDFGFSKDGKHQHVQVMLALIVTKYGMPIAYEEFPGNCFEGHTLIPVLNKIKDSYKINNIVLVEDAALMNKINLQELDRQEIKYVIAAKIKNPQKDIKQKILDNNHYQIISKTDEEIKAKIIDSGEGDYIVSYHSSKRARKDEYDREKSIERVKKYINSTAKSKLTGCLKKSYVRVSKDSKIQIDLCKLEIDRQYDGFFGIRTNIKNADPKELLESYRGLWQVEQTFRIAKTNLEIRPVFHYSPKRIRAHFAICYMALALVRYVDFALKYEGIFISNEQLHLILSRIRKVHIIDSNNELFELLENPPVEAISIYKALKIRWHKKFDNRSSNL